MIERFFNFLKIPALFNSLEGRCTTFFVAFFVTGNFFYWLRGKIDPSYLTFMGMLLTYVVGHSIKEDYFNNKVTNDKQS